MIAAAAAVFFFFFNLKVWGNPASNKSLSTIFLIAFAHFMSLCHVLVILTIFHTLSLLLYLLWWPLSVIVDVRIVIVLGWHRLHPYKIVNLIKWCGVPASPLTGDFPISQPLLVPPYPLRHYNIEIRQLITLERPVCVQLKGRAAHLSLSQSSQKLEMFQNSKERVLKAEID